MALSPIAVLPGRGDATPDKRLREKRCFHHHGAIKLPLTRQGSLFSYLARLEHRGSLRGPPWGAQRCPQLGQAAPSHLHSGRRSLSLRRKAAVMERRDDPRSLPQMTISGTVSCPVSADNHRACQMASVRARPGSQLRRRSYSGIAPPGRTGSVQEGHGACPQRPFQAAP